LLLNESDDSVAVIAFVCNHMGSVDTCQQGYSLNSVMYLAPCKTEAQGLAFGVSNHVNLGAQSSSGTPQSLAFGPPFPLAACWCALTTVESIMMYLLSASASSTSKIRSQIPDLAQRVNR
jgi:hypothetical protein